MIEKISWASYATALLTIVVIYYIVIVLLYYRKEISVIATVFQRPFLGREGLKRKASVADKEIISACPFISDPDTGNEKILSETSDISTEAFDLVEKIKNTILQYAERQYIKEEIITGLQLLIKEYPRLRYSPYTASINNIITKEIETHCSIRLEDDEVKRLWI